MSKYTDLQDNILSIFGTAEWEANNIKTFPANYETSGTEFIRVSVIAGSGNATISSKSGLIIIDIFAIAGNGPARSAVIADLLDAFLVNKSFDTLAGVTQLENSSCGVGSYDTENPSLWFTKYSIPFNHFGV